MWYRRLSVLVASSALLSLVVGLAMAAPAAESKDHFGKVVSTSVGTLVMTDADGKHQHTHVINEKCKISLNGQPVKLEELKKNAPITVTTEQRDGKEVVTEVATSSS